VEDQTPTRRQPYATRVWPPPDGQDALPPSGRMYGTPVAPPARRLPVWVPRALIAVGAVVTAAAVITGLVHVVLSGARGGEAVPVSVADNLAGVTYPVPPGWREGMVAPVTAFTSVLSHGDQAIVMTRPGDQVAAADLRQATIDLTERYSRLLLHGDRVIVVTDRDVTVAGRPGHTRALRAEYRDVVNRPSYLRVMLLTGPGDKSTIVLGIAQPDAPAARADINAIMSGVR